jgi:hypothetical protein
MKFALLQLTLILLFISCQKEQTEPYNVSGRVTNGLDAGLEGVKVQYVESEFTLTDHQGYWEISGLINQNVITPVFSNYTFTPASFQVERTTTDITFSGVLSQTENQEKVYSWFKNQQLVNGLLESAENGNVVSLYDNALAAMVFMLREDYEKAEKIFDFFNSKIATELTSGVGGFSQLRDRNGVPNNHRWMGDNAWLLIALNNYKIKTGNATYDILAAEIQNWLVSLQDADGGLFAGYAADNSLLNYKVTEGNIDAFNAIEGFTIFHSDLLDFLKNDRWDDLDKNLVAWPTNPTYLYALDLHPWSYAIFKDYPVSALTTAQRFLTTQTATVGGQITGYCFDEDKDVVWPEGTGQMALAFGLAGMHNEKELYLNEMENIFLQSVVYSNSGGFTYASNPGTHYGNGALWSGADTEIAISGGAWYLFAKYGFNPFALGRNKNIPVGVMFWLN